MSMTAQRFISKCKHASVTSVVLLAQCYHFAIDHLGHCIFVYFNIDSDFQVFQVYSETTVMTIRIKLNL